MNKLVVAIGIAALFVSFLFLYWVRSISFGRGVGNIAFGFYFLFGLVTGLVLVFWGIASKKKEGK